MNDFSNYTQIELYTLCNEQNDKTLLNWLDSADSWDDAIVEPAAAVLCRRMHIEYDDYDDFDSLFYELERRVHQDTWYAIVINDDNDWSYGSYGYKVALDIAQRWKHYNPHDEVKIVYVLMGPDPTAYDEEIIG